MSQSHEKSEASAKYKWIGTRPIVRTAPTR